MSRKNKYNNKIINKVITSYGKKSYDEISKITHLTINQIQTIVYKFINKRFSRGKSPFSYRPQRIYHVKDSVFNISTYYSCYWAGMLAADGNISKNRITLTLQERDRKHLRLFSNFLDYKGTIKKYIKKYIYKGIERPKSCCTICFTSKKVAFDLNERFNITPRKSLTLKPPCIYKKSLIDCFIIGYIDGDGSISLYKGKRQKKLSLQIIGTKKVLKWIQNRFSEILEEKLDCIYKSRSIFVLVISDKRARKIIKHLTQYNVPRLKRKWSKKVINHCLNYRKFFNKRKHNRIIKMFKNGLSIKEISKIMNVTYQAIYWYIQKSKRESVELDNGMANIDDLN